MLLGICDRLFSKIKKFLPEFRKAIKPKCRYRYQSKVEFISRLIRSSTMLRKSLGFLFGATVLTGLSASFAAPSQAEEGVRFYCDNSGYVPVTVAHSYDTGYKTQIIKWTSSYFDYSGYDAETRCGQVSARFQKAYNEGRLNYITAGIVNDQTVVCATDAGGSCNSRNILFTLKPGADAGVTLQRIFDVRDSGSSALEESGGRSYVNVSEFLKQDK
jgi:hypothetical protein